MTLLQSWNELAVLPGATCFAALALAPGYLSPRLWRFKWPAGWHEKWPAGWHEKWPARWREKWPARWRERIGALARKDRLVGA